MGLGWDSHRLAPGRALILGGVIIPSEFGLEGHSDADILSHAITDALLGAAALGDIGMHFPDTDPRMERRIERTVPGARGAASARARIQHRQRGFHGDSGTAQAQGLPPGHPRITGPYTLELGVDRVSVKFKTAENVGPVGEGKSAEAHAVILLQRDTIQRQP